MGCLGLVGAIERDQWESATLGITTLLGFRAAMSQVFDLLVKGGPVMWPLLGMSIATVAVTLERTVFWVRLMAQEDRIVHDVLAAAKYSLEDAAITAREAQTLPIGRFLLAPLMLKQATPETFNLALETAAEREFVKMRRGDKLLETIVAVAPLLGLLGTVTGLIATFNNLNIGGGGDTKAATAAAAGIGEALLTTAFGMIVAIMALVVFRVLVVLQSQQIDYFTEVGSRLELIYRQVWYEPLFPTPDLPSGGGRSPGGERPTHGFDPLPYADRPPSLVD
jgi:biopolymer transport protein ExbB